MSLEWEGVYIDGPIQSTTTTYTQPQTITLYVIHVYERRIPTKAVVIQFGALQRPTVIGKVRTTFSNRTSLQP